MEAAIAARLTQRLTEFAPDIGRASAALAELDCLLSLAIAARELNLCRPQVRKWTPWGAGEWQLGWRTGTCGRNAQLLLLQYPRHQLGRMLLIMSHDRVLVEVPPLCLQLSRANELRIVGGRHLLTEQVWWVGPCGGSCSAAYSGRDFFGEFTSRQTIFVLC